MRIFRCSVVASLLAGLCATAGAAETSLRMSSDPGDYTGAGQEYFYTAADGTFATPVSPANGASIRFVTPSEDHWWYLDFAAPLGAPLTVGSYPGALFPPGDPSVPSLNVYGDGRGCSGVTGSFRVKEVVYRTPGEIDSLWAVFEQHCGTQSPALRGDVRINAHVVVAVGAPFHRTVEKTHALTFDVTATDAEGRHVTLAAEGLPEGATFTDHGDNSGTFTWVPGFTQTGFFETTFLGDNGAGTVNTAVTEIRVLGTTSLLMQGEPGDYIVDDRILYFTPSDGTFEAHRNGPDGISVTLRLPTTLWHLDFAAPEGTPLVVGSYPGATRFPFQEPSEPGLNVSGDGRGCNELTGSFDVKQLEFGPDGTDVSAFRATFEQHCEGVAAAVRGEIRVNADVPVLLTAPTTRAIGQGKLLTFGVSGVDAAGGAVTLSVGGAPAGATFTDHGDGTGTFRWTPGGGQVGAHALTFTARNAQGDTDTLPMKITVRLSNDDFDDARVIAGLPFSEARDTRAATESPDDPGGCFGFGASVWYAYTPAHDTVVHASAAGSDYDTTVSVLIGERGALETLACDFEEVGFAVTAGRTYYVMVRGFGSGGHLRFSMTGEPPFAVGVVLDALGSFDRRTGTATIGGVVTCSEPGLVVVSGSLRQRALGSRLVEGEFEVAVSCTGRTRWSASVTSADGAFTGGVASASVDAAALDEGSGRTAQAAHARTVWLIRRSPAR